MQRVGILNGENINYDHDFSSLVDGLFTPGVVEGLEITSGQIAYGKAFVKVTRTGGKSFYVVFENTANLAFDTSGTKKIFIEIEQSKIDDGSLNAEDGTGIGQIKSAAAYPASNFVKLASINAGVITDEREFVTTKDALNLTKEGNTFNGNSELVKLDVNGKLPAVDGSNLTNLAVDTDNISVAMIAGENIGALKAVRGGKNYNQLISSYSEGTGNSTGHPVGSSSGDYSEYGFNFRMPSNTSNEIGALKVYLAKQGSPSDSIKAEFYSVSSFSDLTPGTLVGTSNLIAGSTLTTTATEYSFDAPTGNLFTPLNYYRVVLKRTGAANSSNYYRVYQASSNTSNNGSEYGLVMSGSNLVNFNLARNVIEFKYIRPEDETKVYECKAQDYYNENYIGIAKAAYNTDDTAHIAVTGIMQNIVGLTDFTDVNVSSAGDLEQNTGTTPYVKVGKMLRDDIIKLD